MAVVHTEIYIAAPITLCFDLARSADIHPLTAAFTCERVVDGKTSGLLEAGDTITFEAVHLGVRQRLTARVVEMDAPVRFVDEMVAGAFRRLRHVHAFEAAGPGTICRDTLEFEAPFGPLGRMAERLFLTRYLHRFLIMRNKNLKRLAESGEYRKVAGWTDTQSASA